MDGLSIPLTFSVIALVLSFLALALGLAALGLVIGLRNSTHTTQFVPQDLDDLVDADTLISKGKEEPEEFSVDNDKILSQMFRKIANPMLEPDDEFNSTNRIVD